MPPPLFRDRVRTDSSTKRHDESSFVFLDRVDDVVFGRVRVLLNEWFARWPGTGAEPLRSRFESREYPQFLSAFWELYLHEGSRRLGDIQVEPATAESARRRDFVVSAGMHGAFTIEAVLAADDDHSRARESRLGRVYDLINEIPNTDFSIALDLEGSGSPPGAQLRDRIAQWLSSLDRSHLRPMLEAGRSREMPSETFAVGDWRWSAQALPASDENAAKRGEHSLIGIYPGRGGWGNPNRLRARLRNKRVSQYVQSAQPYIVALLDTAVFSGADSLVDALYGDQAVEFSHDDPASAVVDIRKANGHWSSNRNTRLSAVLYGRELLPWSVASVAPTLWINPWAKNPLLTALPWACYAKIGDDGTVRYSPAKIPAHIYFDLPEGWPGPERPFRALSDDIAAGHTGD